jgi:hypothetical protein
VSRRGSPTVSPRFCPQLCRPLGVRHGLSPMGCPRRGVFQRCPPGMSPIGCPPRRPASGVPQAVSPMGVRQEVSTLGCPKYRPPIGVPQVVPQWGSQRIFHKGVAPSRVPNVVRLWVHKRSHTMCCPLGCVPHSASPRGFPKGCPPWSVPQVIPQGVSVKWCPQIADHEGVHTTGLPKGGNP